MKNKISFILILFSQITFAQVQNYNWNFGNNMGMGWKNSESKVLPGMFGFPDELLSDLPIYYNGSAMATLEGCFTISDYNGDLIVYSDGITLWNNNNTVISNGTSLTGSPSSAQSGTIAPYPHSFEKFIVLTLNNVNTNNLRFSVLEKNQTQYTVTNKNTQLTGNKGLLGETVTAGKHSNKNDIWVLAVGRGNNNIDQNNLTGHPYLNVWRIFDDSPGNNTIQHELVTTLDLGQQGVIGNNNPNGYVKFTNDTRHFVWVNYGKGGNTANGGVPFICYGDFNNTTGEISNVKIKRGIQEGTSYGYGVEFTNDNKYLYVTLAPDDVNTSSASLLLAYDFEELLNARTQAEIDAIQPLKKIYTPNSNVLTSGNPFFGSIETGLDGRFYIASIAKRELFVIDNPKDPQNLRMYRYKNLLTIPDYGTAPYMLKATYWGLPNFAVPWYNTAIEISQTPSSICINKIIPFDLFIVDGHGFDRVVKMVVDYGDGSPTKEYTGTEITPGLKSESHMYKKVGDYKISVNSYDANNELINTTVKTIHVNVCSIKVNPYLRGEIE